MIFFSSYFSLIFSSVVWAQIGLFLLLVYAICDYVDFCGLKYWWLLRITANSILMLDIFYPEIFYYPWNLCYRLEQSLNILGYLLTIFQVIDTKPVVGHTSRKCISVYNIAT